MAQYSFLKDEWDGSPKTVWSRKKQNKLFKILIKKYPTANDLRKKLFQINTEESVKLGKYINPKWDDDQYYRFITSNVIKYSSAGKIILSQLVGSGIGTLIGYGVHKYIQPTSVEVPSKQQYSDKLQSIDHDVKLNQYPEDVRNIITDFRKNDYTDSVLDNMKIKQMNKANPWKEILPYGSAIGTKSLTSYGIYKFLDSIDKPNKKNA